MDKDRETCVLEITYKITVNGQSIEDTHYHYLGIDHSMDCVTYAPDPIPRYDGVRSLVKYIDKTVDDLLNGRIK